MIEDDKSHLIPRGLINKNFITTQLGMAVAKHMEKNPDGFVLASYIVAEDGHLEVSMTGIGDPEALAVCSQDIKDRIEEQLRGMTGEKQKSDLSLN